MNTINNKLNTVEQSQKEVNKQINKLIAEATMLLYEIIAIAEKGAINQ
jgi:hypothetical protein